MRRLRLATAARRDLDHIYLHIRDWAGDERRAEAVTDRVLAHCEKLAMLPGTLGRSRREFHPDLRSVPFQGYAIFFRYTDEELEVVHIINGRRDIDAVFEADED